jgi:hypothetical protein
MQREVVNDSLEQSEWFKAEVSKPRHSLLGYVVWPVATFLHYVYYISNTVI